MVPACAGSPCRCPARWGASRPWSRISRNTRVRLTRWPCCRRRTRTLRWPSPWNGVAATSVSSDAGVFGPRLALGGPWGDAVRAAVSTPAGHAIDPAHLRERVATAGTALGAHPHASAPSPSPFFRADRPASHLADWPAAAALRGPPGRPASSARASPSPRTPGATLRAHAGHLGLNDIQGVATRRRSCAPRSSVPARRGAPPRLPALRRCSSSRSSRSSCMTDSRQSNGLSRRIGCGLGGTNRSVPQPHGTNAGLLVHYIFSGPIEGHYKCTRVNGHLRLRQPNRRVMRPLGSCPSSARASYPGSDRAAPGS